MAWTIHLRVQKITKKKTKTLFFKAANNQEDSYQMLHKSFVCQHFSIQLFEVRYEINKRTDLLYVTDQLVSLRQKFSNFLKKFARSRSRSISVLLWTMIIHASFSIFLTFFPRLIKNMPSCKSFLCIWNKHNYLCLEIFRSKCFRFKPLARVDPHIIVIININNSKTDPLKPNWCESPCKKAFGCGYNKDRMAITVNVTWAELKIVLFFPLHFAA